MKVWLTRTRPGADRQARDLEAAGYQVVVSPVIDVEPLDGAVPEGPFDVVVFLSEHAVRCGLPSLDALPWLAEARLLAVGERTAAALGSRDVTVATPGRASSEGLLDAPDLADPAGRRVLLVCGAGGRALLGTTLAGRGADVARFECYRRVRVPGMAAEAVTCDVVIAASGEGLEHAAALWLAAGGRADVPVLVPSARVAGIGVELGLSNLHDCGGADSEAWLRGLAELPPTETS